MGRYIEMFTANCHLCPPTIEAVKQAIDKNDTLKIYIPEMCVDGSCCLKVEGYGVTAVPSVVVDGKLMKTGKATPEEMKRIFAKCNLNKV